MKPSFPLVLCALFASGVPGWVSAQEVIGRGVRRQVVPARARKPVPEPVPDTLVRAARKLSATTGGLMDLGSRRFFGSSLTSLGDLDGDGVPDLASGIFYDGGSPFGDSGLWIVFLDEEGGVRHQQELSSEQGGFTGAIDNTFGSALAGLGDIDGDGNADLAVGEWGADRVWILLLNADGTVRSQGSLVGPVSSRFGIALVALGDLDGDGVTELVVGSTHGGSVHAQGSATVVFLDSTGAAKGMQTIGDAQGGFSGVLEENDRFGSSVVALGDLDRDGLVDLGVGAPGDDDGGASTGAMWMLFLNADGTVCAQQKLAPGQGGLTGIVPGDAFGGAATALGDLDGDGNPELVVGDPGASAFTGGVWLAFLNSDGTVRSQARIDATQDGLDTGDYFGSALAGLPDLDGDGLSELAVGAPAGDDGGEDLGAVWILSLGGLVHLDFETEDDFATPLVNGRQVDPSEEFGNLVDIDGVGPNYGATIFDSDPDGPNSPAAGGSDPDLLVGLGNLLVLQENPEQSVPDVFDQPDDSVFGGTLVFDFLRSVRMHSVDLIDICPGAPLQDATVTLIDAAANLRTYCVPGGWTNDIAAAGSPGYGTLSLDTLESQPGFVTSATASESEGFDPQAVVRMEVTLSSSGALDNVKFDPNPGGGGLQTVTLQPGKDNTLIQSSTGGVSNGAGFQFFAGRVGFMGLGTARRGVLAFDVAGDVPAGATITSASLTLHLSLTNTSARDVGLHVLAKDWGEGTSASGGGAGDVSTPGDATWIHTFYDTELWDTPGGDFDPSALATTTVDEPGFYTWTSPALVASVQAWLDDPTTNFGWAVLGDESFFQTAQGFDSRENPDVTQRPVLTIEFSGGRSGAAPQRGQRRTR